ncbi:maleylpyruvate isomerase family mycothiol-dependent enzyme [Polymorphospora lycopeni]|uniref:Maleylpyruvate isomerase family mycothiol-dependent enzyme n=1 Tax=Polymorphospora lycopeni TaxID=3140240 RepID=A0ABV5CNM2_9ACTN
MPSDRVLPALRAEAAQLAAVLRELPADDWSRPTPCPPWNVAGLLGHVLTILEWLPGMLAAPAPPRATVSAAGYYRPDHRFATGTNAARIGLAERRVADVADGAALAVEFDGTWRRIVEQCGREPADRVVRTRHGDAMLLTDFLVTRIVEVGIHGLDLATALDRRPWLTPAAAGVLTDLLLPDHGIAAVADLGWDEITFLRKATGRQPLTPAETARVEQRAIRWLTLG